MNDWRKPCEHGQFEPHTEYVQVGVDHAAVYKPWTCPGGAPGGDWRKPCEHGRYDPHEYGSWADEKDCPGGSPVTAADLEGLGITEWICSAPFAPRCGPESRLKIADWHSLCGYRLLIPIPDPQPATEGMS